MCSGWSYSSFSIWMPITRLSGPQKRRDLRRDLLVPALRELQVDGIVGARAGRGLDHPIRMTAVAHLAVAPRADPHDDIDADPLRGLEESGDVEISLEADLDHGPVRGGSRTRTSTPR